jgi:hypothetical protein
MKTAQPTVHADRWAVGKFFIFFTNIYLGNNIFFGTHDEYEMQMRLVP